MPSEPDRSLDEQVLERILDGCSTGHLGDLQLMEMVRRTDPLLDLAAVSAAVARIRARMSGTGAIEHLLADPTVTDILVNGPGPVWVERHGQLEQTDVTLDAEEIGLLIERSLGPLGLRADRAMPVVDARLPDGSRLHVVLPPLAVAGPYLAIRRFSTKPLPLARFCSPAVENFLRWALDARLNIIVCGGTGAGKTTLLNSLCHRLGTGERVVTVEDSAELRLPGEHVVALETRPATPDGIAAQTIRDLVRAALRMRPDRLIVGEVRGAEALDLLQALNTGHEGGLSTCHANNPEDSLRRLETMSSMATEALPLPAIREQIASAVDLLIQVERRPDGHRRVTTVAETVPNPRASRRVRVLARDGKIIADPQRAPRCVRSPQMSRHGAGAGGIDGDPQRTPGR